MIVWGGSIDDGYVGPEGGRYNPTTDTWTLMNPSGSRRSSHVPGERLDRDGSHLLGRLQSALHSVLQRWRTLQPGN